METKAYIAGMLQSCAWDGGKGLSIQPLVGKACLVGQSNFTLHFCMLLGFGQ